MARRMFLVSEDRMQGLESARDDLALNNILSDPLMNPRNKVFALARVHEQMDNAEKRVQQPEVSTPPNIATAPRNVSNLERRAGIITGTAGKFQKGHAEKFLRFLRETNMDITEAMEPVKGDLVLTGANLADLVHWVSNPINQSYRPPQLQQFMQMLAQSHMPATMIPNKDRRLLYAALLRDAGLTRISNFLDSIPATITTEQPELTKQSGNGVSWSFY